MVTGNRWPKEKLVAERKVVNSWPKEKVVGDWPKEKAVGVWPLLPDCEKTCS
jgi:hypothetical protein